jgi:membrane protein
LRPQGVLHLARALYRQMSRDRLSIVAAGVAFYALLAVFPTLAALVAFYGLAFDAQQVERQVASLSGLLPQQALDVLLGELRDLSLTDRRALGWGAAAALALTLWSASRGVKMLIEALNVAYDAREQRNFLVLNAVALALTLGAILGAILAIAAVVVLPSILRFLGLGPLLEGMIAYARWPILAAAVALGLAIAYRYGPSRPRVPWPVVARGALFATALWIAGSALFSLYVSSFDSYNKTYGSVAAVVILLMWFLLSAYAVLLGAELNAELERTGAAGLERRDTPRPGHAPCVQGSERRPAMLKILNPTIHGALDYGLVLAFLFLPGVLGFPNMAANLSQIIGLVYLGASLLTRYPLGAVKLIPFPVHGVLESIMAASWIAMPWLFEFADHAGARNFFVAAGVGLLAVAALTDYRSTSAVGEAYTGAERRRNLIDRRQRALAVRSDHRRGERDRRAYSGA